MLTSRFTQFTAILGDLTHKQDLYLAFGDFGPSVECYFSNSHQASWLIQHAPALLPPGHHSEHFLGTVFEFQYYSNLSLRLDYLAWFRSAPECGTLPLFTTQSP